MSKKSKILITVAVVVVIAVLAILGIREGFNSYYRSSYQRLYTAEVSKFGKKYDVDENLIYAIIRTESNFNQHAVSDVNARGLMQIMPDTFDWVKTKIKETDIRDSFNLTFDDMYNPHFNILYGTYLISYLLKEYNKDIGTSLAAYHAGRSKVNEWLKDSNMAKNGKISVDNIPYNDTKEYVKKVMETYQIYKRIY